MGLRPPLLCEQEGAEHLIAGELLEPAAASGEEGEPRPRHPVRPLPQQHHTPLCTDQRGFGKALQEGTDVSKRFSREVLDSSLFKLNIF